MSVADLYRNRGVNPLAVQVGLDGFDMTTNLLTSQGFTTDFEVNTFGWGGGCTVSQTTTNPIAGSASLKAVVVDADNLFAVCAVTVEVGKAYLWMGKVRTYATAGVMARAFVATGASASGSYTDCSASVQTLWMLFTATATTCYPVYSLNEYHAGDFFLLDTPGLYVQK